MVDIEPDLHIIAARTVCHKARKIAERFHHLAAVADERAGVLALNAQHGGFSLPHGCDLNFVHTHFRAYLAQIFHGVAHLPVFGKVDELLRFCRRFGIRLFGRRLRLCRRRLRGVSVFCSRGLRRLGPLLGRGAHRLCRNSRNGRFRFLHVCAHLCGNAAKQLALRQLQYLDLGLVRAKAQLLQRKLGGLLYGFCRLDHFTYHLYPPCQTV